MWESLAPVAIMIYKRDPCDFDNQQTQLVVSIIHIE